METITEIKIIMTLALAFYVVAIYLGVKQQKFRLPRFVHISFAFIGFTLDMWATYMMESLRDESWQVYKPLLIGHTLISTLAILLFFTMFYLGIRNKIKTHKTVVWWGFMPTWLLAYTTGIALVS